MQKLRLHRPVRLARLCMTRTQNPNPQDQEAFPTIFRQACIYISSNVACAKVGHYTMKTSSFCFFWAELAGLDLEVLLNVKSIWGAPPTAEQPTPSCRHGEIGQGGWINRRVRFVSGGLQLTNDPVQSCG
jgi:hypothetical protein